MLGACICARHGFVTRLSASSSVVVPSWSSRDCHFGVNGRFYVKAWSLFARFAVAGGARFGGVIGRARLGEGGRGAENAPVDAGAAPSRVDRRDCGVRRRR